MVRQSFQRFIANTNVSKGGDAAITRQTLKTIGPSPAIVVIYRDRDRLLNSPAEYDVIRLSGNEKHAYALFDVDANGKSTLGPTAICVVGDTRCAKFYEWP
jgi:hypothetical protein